MLAAAGVLAVTATTTPVHANGDIFEMLSGKWRGKGQVRASVEKNKEVMRCKMNNSHKEAEGRLALTGRCSVAGFPFSLRGYIQQNGTKNSYRASMFQAIAALKQESFSGKRSGKKLNFVFRAKDVISKEPVNARISVVPRGKDKFDIVISRTDPKTNKNFNVGTIKFSR